jgi:peptidoglycan/xylan/chitin deacetylase (PgdA/CDA1 family)
MTPLLITMDLETARDHDLPQQHRVLDRLRNDLSPLGIPLTLFATGDAAEEFAPELGAFLQTGHEVGCHGLTHNHDEDFQRMAESSVRNILAAATSLLQRS